MNEDGAVRSAARVQAWAIVQVSRDRLCAARGGPQARDRPRPAGLPALEILVLPLGSWSEAGSRYLIRTDWGAVHTPEPPVPGENTDSGSGHSCILREGLRPQRQTEGPSRRGEVKVKSEARLMVLEKGAPAATGRVLILPAGACAAGRLALHVAL